MYPWNPENARCLTFEIFGDDRIFFASDYPHERQRAQYLEDFPRIEARPDISAAAKRKILADNARRFYPLPSDRSGNA